MNYIINPNTDERVHIQSDKGRYLLKKYIEHYQSGGSSKKSIKKQKKSKNIGSLKHICNTALYKRKTPTNIVELPCNKGNYSNDHRNSIKFIKKYRGIDNTEFVEKIAEQAKRIIKKYDNPHDKITILGGTEDILGFFIKYMNREEYFKKFIILSVKDDIWTTDFNYDFINCSINSGRNDIDNFRGLNDKLPIVMIHVGKKNIVKGHNPEEIITKLPRVTTCEIQWIHEKINQSNSKYSWKSETMKVDGKKVWVHLLLRN